MAVDNKFLGIDSPYRELLLTKYKSLQEELAEWQSQDYEKKQEHLEHLKFKSPSGHIVRSKSELLIDKALYEAGIPFRYEAKLSLRPGCEIYPDFTARKLSTGEIHYWEHFGRMDDPEYVKSVTWKMQEYSKSGIIPGHNLFMTFESSDHPLTLEMINDVVDKLMEID